MIAAEVNARVRSRKRTTANEPPLDPQAWFDTGDLGELDADDFLRVKARAGDLIITGGENVYPAEVEQVLEAFPGIASAGVFGLPDATWGEIVAAAVVGPGGPIEEAALATSLAARLSPHKLPRRICDVAVLPYTCAGKLDRAALATGAGPLRTLPISPPPDR